MTPARPDVEAWPLLPLDGWRDTCDTLHLWTQIVGKTRLALAPAENHWWHVPLYLTSRGLSTSPMPVGRRTCTVEFDFLDHQLRVSTSDGAAAALPLVPQTVAEFHAAYLALMRTLGVDLHIRPVPVEVVTAIPFAADRVHAAYDPDAANRCWRILVQADRLLKRFRGEFLGKSSPVHFFWGGFDLAMTRFSGRPAPRHPGGIPNCPAWVMVEAYSHECSSAGFWPGGEGFAAPAFYAYAYPEPAGYRDESPGPEAWYHRDLGEFILPYDAVRGAADPDGLVLDFLRRTYAAAATLGGWDRVRLERPHPA